MRPVPKRPEDLLRDHAAPRELIEWVRKMPAQDAPTVAWTDVARAEWLPYIAVLRGASSDAILKTTCACIVELFPATGDATGARLLGILREGAEGGKAALAKADATLEDMRLASITQANTQPPPEWLPLAKLVLELSRAATRGNPLMGPALALRMIIEARGRRASAALINRFRDLLTLGN